MPSPIGAALCPPTPLLARELTGLDPVVPELRQACAAAVARLVRSGPEVIAVVGPAARTATWPSDGRLDLAAFAPAFGPGTGPTLPLPLGLGARLLDEAGYRERRLLQSVGPDEPGPACLRLGADLAGLADRVGLLIMANGSACRSLRAPGYLDPRAADFDAVLERAVRDGGLGALRAMDDGLARELLVARPAWQVLAGAMPGRVPAAEVFYRDDPFGVFYLVAWLGRAGCLTPWAPGWRPVPLSRAAGRRAPAGSQARAVRVLAVADQDRAWDGDHLGAVAADGYYAARGRSTMAPRS